MCKRGLPSFQGKIETITPDFPGKMTVFSSFDPTFPPVPPYNLASHPNKNYIYNNRAICWNKAPIL